MWFFVILDELNPDGRIWLFGFKLYFFKCNSLLMRRTSKGVGPQGCAQMGFLVLFIMTRSVWSRQWLQSFLAVWRPRHLPILPAPRAWAKAALIFLHEKLHGQRTLAGYSPWGHKESDTTEHTCALGISHSILWEKKFNANSAAGSVFIFPW